MTEIGEIVLQMRTRTNGKISETAVRTTTTRNSRMNVGEYRNEGGPQNEQVRA